jgi:hypothetical protein
MLALSSRHFPSSAAIAGAVSMKLFTASAPQGQPRQGYGVAKVLHHRLWQRNAGMFNPGCHIPGDCERVRDIEMELMR